MNALGADPAERSRYLRHFYRNWRPTRFGRFHNRIYAWMSGLGLTSRRLITLQVNDRGSGRLRSTVLATVSYDGRRYLVSMLGDNSEWVKNVRASGGFAVIKRGRAGAVALVELPPERRAPVLKAWCQVATSGRRHFPVSHDAQLSEFEALAADYPVFRIDPGEDRSWSLGPF